MTKGFLRNEHPAMALPSSVQTPRLVVLFIKLVRPCCCGCACLQPEGEDQCLSCRRRAGPQQPGSAWLLSVQDSRAVSRIHGSRSWLARLLRCRARDEGLLSANKVGRTGQDLRENLAGPKNAPWATHSLSRKKILSCVRADEHVISRRADVTH